MKNWLTTNTGLKLVALGLAILTWYFVRSLTSEWRLLGRIPVEYRVKPHLTIMDTTVNSVNVTVRGTRDDVRQVTPADLTAIVDLTRDDRPGTRTVRLTPRMVRHSTRVQVVDIVPATVTVRIEELVDRDLPVQPVFHGKLQPGLVIEQTNFVPPVVRLRGPKSTLDALPAVPTLPIDLTGRRFSFREYVQVAPPDSDITVVKHPWIEADVRIGEPPAQPAEVVP